MFFHIIILWNWLLNRTVSDTSANSISRSNEENGRLAANILLDAGHQRLAFMAGVEITSTNLARRKGFTDRLRERGYEGLMEAQGDYSYDSDYQAALHLLDRDNPPDGIFCAADIMALGAMDAARYQLGIKIPDELSIVGHDDIPVAGWPAYDLTTIRQPIRKMVEAAIQLITPEDDTIATGETVLLPGELIWRSSARLPEEPERGNY